MIALNESAETLSVEDARLATFTVTVQSSTTFIKGAKSYIAVSVDRNRYGVPCNIWQGV